MLLSSYSISRGYSPELGKIKVSLFGSIKFLYSKFTTTPNSKVTLTEGIPIDIEYEEDNLRTEKVKLMLGAIVKRKEEFSEIETEYSKYH